MRKRSILAIALAGLMGVAKPAFAYVGPGAGLTMLGALWGLLVVILAAVGFIVAWPVRRLLKRRRERSRQETPEEPRTAPRRARPF